MLADPRAVAMARAYQENAGDAWDRVPAAEEEVPLVTIGTHSRGAIFLDGGAHRTSELEAVIESIEDGVATVVDDEDGEWEIPVEELTKA